VKQVVANECYPFEHVAVDQIMPPPSSDIVATEDVLDILLRERAQSNLMQSNQEQSNQGQSNQEQANQTQANQAQSHQAITATFPEELKRR
jgi:hypothetical protein